MIHKPTQEQLAERFQRIPVELRKAIASNANADKLFEIGKQHGLLIDKTGELAAETGLLMLGITHPNEFVGNLAERLKIDRASASKIADDINREIFAPVREHLRAMFGVTPQKEISEERLPETGRLTSKIPDSSSTALSAISRQATKPVNANQQQTTLEDLEAELERALAEEKGIQPLSMVKKLIPIPKPAVQPQQSYKGTDPYREQVGEDLPNVRGKAYVPQSMEREKEKIPPQPLPTGRQVPFSKEEVPPLEKGDKGGFQVSRPISLGEARPFGAATSRTQPTPTPPKSLEENSPFSPLGNKNKFTNANEPKKTDAPLPSAPKQNDTLPAFRGFKMDRAVEQPSAAQQQEHEKNIHREQTQ